MNNVIKFYKIENCYNIEITYGESVNHFFPAHFHESYNIGIVIDGKIIISIENKDYMLEKEFCYCINPKEVHCLKSNEEIMSYYVISIPKEEVSKIIGNKNTKFKRKIINCKENSILIRKFIEESIKNNNNHFEIQNILIEILQNVLEVSENIEKKDFIALKKAEEYINNHYKDEIDLSKLSNEVFVSPFHLIREFKKYIGLSPFDYLIQKRVKESKLLLKTGISIGECAIEMGFYDQSHFIKYFKKHTGLTPKKYIKESL